VPSPETEKNIYTAATSFAADNQTAEKFKTSGAKLHAHTIAALKKDAYDLEGLQGPARDVVKWAFNGKKGDVSPVYTVDKKHLVAMIEDIRPKGLPDLDAVREVVKAEVVKTKKYELLAKKITDSKAASADDLAAKTGKQVTEAQRASFGNPNVNGSYEPKVVAAALASPAGKLSQPIQGNAGAYAIQTTAVQDPPKASDYGMYTFQLKQKLMGKSRDAQEVEKKLASIDDNRFDFF
ncbi:MAG: PpiC-type peptidyl-prolyl cis-trans isomerase, partial [Bacteroidota bacterium]|nr:PpiC-type peptidyl-prolyl cis-trans isomerase [Bacteroidota bacterium]